MMAESGLSPKSGLSVSPVKMIDVTLWSDGMNVLLTQLPTSMTASRMWNSQSTTPLSSSSPKSDAGP